MVCVCVVPGMLEYLWVADHNCRLTIGTTDAFTVCGSFPSPGCLCFFVLSFGIGTSNSTAVLRRLSLNTTGTGHHQSSQVVSSSSTFNLKRGIRDVKIKNTFSLYFPVDNNCMFLWSFCFMWINLASGNPWHEDQQAQGKSAVIKPTTE